MERCLIVETRDPVDHRDFESMVGLASGIRRQGMVASLLLTENAVIGVRRGVAPCLQALLDDGIVVSVDRLALRERGIPEEDLLPGVQPAEIDLIVDWLEARASVLWR